MRVIVTSKGKEYLENNDRDSSRSRENANSEKYRAEDKPVYRRIESSNNFSKSRFRSTRPSKLIIRDQSSKSKSKFKPKPDPLDFNKLRSLYSMSKDPESVVSKLPNCKYHKLKPIPISRILDRLQIKQDDYEFDFRPRRSKLDKSNEGNRVSFSSLLNDKAKQNIKHAAEIRDKNIKFQYTNTRVPDDIHRSKLKVPYSELVNRTLKKDMNPCCSSLVRYISRKEDLSQNFLDLVSSMSKQDNLRIERFDRISLKEEKSKEKANLKRIIEVNIEKNRRSATFEYAKSVQEMEKSIERLKEQYNKVSNCSYIIK